MAQYADEQSYEEMITALQNFQKSMDENCTVMEQAGTDCVDNTDGDPAAVKGNAKLCECTKKIREALENVQNIIQALQKELSDIQEAARKADSI